MLTLTRFAFRRGSAALLFVCSLMAASCSSTPEIIEEECLSYVFEGDVLLSTQDQVNRFGKSCYSVINGKLQIGTYDKAKSTITDLSPLKKIRRTGDLHIISNPGLDDLDGLENLNAVENSILIYDNPGLKNLQELSGIRSAHVAVTLYSNAQLNSVEGLQGITEFSNFDIVDNGALRDLEWLSEAERMNCLYIEGNNSLTSLKGLDNVRTINCIYVRSNPQLIDFCALNLLFTIKSKQLEFECSQNGFDVTAEDLASGRCHPFGK